MSQAPEESLPLPKLREDLQLLEGGTSIDGSPSWKIYDPIRNKFFRIGWSVFQLISRWDIGNSSELINRVTNDTTSRVDKSDVEKLITFLHANNLTRDSASGSSNNFVEQYLATKSKWYVWLVKNYLFLKIPICRPRRFLKKTMYIVEPLYSKPFIVSMIVMAFIGLYLVARQWESFLGTFSYFFNLEGAVFYFLALVFIKIIHELGHAYTATRYGSKVASMGVAMLVMMPMLYTDTTDAWRLNSKKQRLLVGAAGMLAELYLAVIFTFLWSFLPDGLLRSAAFVMATTSWVLSLAINLNILMRFDGYYILSDLLEVENLQGRSFALGKWKLREVLFDLRHPAPGGFTLLKRRKLIIYAWSVWIYRFFLFLGIALLVFNFFFKALGLLLLVVEIIWFIVKPIIQEIRVWNDMKIQIRESQRYRYVTVICFLILSLFFIPWNTQIATSAIMQATHKASIHSVSGGVITAIYVNEGDKVKSGQPLLALKSPSLDHDIARAERKYEVTELRSRRRASNIDDLANTQVVFQELQELASLLNGLKEVKAQLVVRAPIDGTVVDMQSNLHPGRWVDNNLRLVQIAGLDSIVLEGVIEGNKLSQIKVGQKAKFIPDEPELNILKAKVTEIENANVQVLETLYFASIYGGDIAVREDNELGLVPEESLYRIRFEATDVETIVPRVVRGQVHIKGEPRSFAFRTYDLIAAVLIRESGF